MTKVEAFYLMTKAALWIVAALWIAFNMALGRDWVRRFRGNITDFDNLGTWTAIVFIVWVFIWFLSLPDTRPLQ